MSKVKWKPGTMVYPLPAVIVSCGSQKAEWNLITIAWTGTVNTNPPMVYISVRPSRHSYNIIKETGEFVINLTNKKMAFATDWCGVKSGKDFNKFDEMKLTPSEAEFVACPMIAESPINIECKVTQVIPLGSHDMFIAEVLRVHADDQFLDSETGAFDMKKAGLIAYSHGNYYELGDHIGKFGYSVMKKKTKKKIKK
ncbi:MAG: flavin reductase family protein [Bacteroidetes bacterium]|nr:MAG: flavin reductase family protein [Bacteroidota bacterium]